MSLPNIPVDIGRLAGFRCVTAPETKTDPTTGQIRTNRDGQRLYLVGIAVRPADSRKAVVLDVQTPTEPQGITEGSLVKLVELRAVPWEIDGRHGISYQAAEILPATQPPGGPATAPPVRAAVKGGDAA